MNLSLLEIILYLFLPGSDGCRWHGKYVKCTFYGQQRCTSIWWPQNGSRYRVISKNYQQMLQISGYFNRLLIQVMVQTVINHSQGRKSKYQHLDCSFYVMYLYIIYYMYYLSKIIIFVEGELLMKMNGTFSFFVSPLTCNLSFKLQNNMKLMLQL